MSQETRAVVVAIMLTGAGFVSGAVVGAVVTKATSATVCGGGR